MAVQSHFKLFVIIGAALFLVGCGGQATSLTAETDDPEFQRGQEYKLRGDSAKALVSFLSVIEKRGENNAPESQLEAGLLLKNKIKEPMEAWIRLRRYVQLKPNSPQADYVRVQIDAAKLEVFRMYLGTPAQPSNQFQLLDQINALQKENGDLRALLASGKTGVSPAPVVPTSGSSRTGRGTAAIDTIVIPPAVETAVVAAAEPPPVLTPVPSPVQQPAARTPAAPAASSQKERVITVQQSEGLYAVARRAYGAAPTNAQIEAIRKANSLTSDNLSKGQQLKIP